MSCIFDLKTLDYSIKRDSERDLKEGICYVCKRLIPEWQNCTPADIEYKPITGGITNILYHVFYDNHDVLLRIFGTNTEYIIDRPNEIKTIMHISPHHFAPKLYGCFGNGRLEEFLPMKPMTPDQMKMIVPTDYVSRIAREIQGLHTQTPPLNRDQTIWDTIEDWMNQAKKLDFSDIPEKDEIYKTIDFDDLIKEFEWLESKLPSKINNFGNDIYNTLSPFSAQAFSFASTIVLCHNDLLAANLMYSDYDERIRIIDYEYSSYNYRAYDFGNHFNEYAGFDGDFAKNYPSVEVQKHFYRAYIEACIDQSVLQPFEDEEKLEEFLDALVIEVNLYSLLSHFYWGIWAFIQAKYSPIDFNFMNYAVLRLDGYKYFKNVFDTDRK